MFDTGRMSLRASIVMPSALSHDGGRPELSAELLAKIKPANLSQDRLLEVPEPLRPLFPAGGLQRGWSVGLGGHGSWGVAMALLATGLGDQGWVAVVGLPNFNLVAAASYGLRLDRVILVEEPGPGRWAAVIATLLEAVDVVVVAPQTRVGARDARRLVGRAREQESILFHLDGGATWPTALNLSLVTSDLRWDGLGQGHGHLRSRQLTIKAQGRRGGARVASVDVLLPNAEGKLASAPARALASSAESEPSSFRPRIVA